MTETVLVTGGAGFIGSPLIARLNDRGYEAMGIDNFNSHLEVISINAEMTLSSFEKKVPGGEALPAVWENWDDFSEQMNAFTKGIATATQTAKEQGQNAAMGQIIDALSCKRCHDHYREKK